MTALDFTRYYLPAEVSDYTVALSSGFIKLRTDDASADTHYIIDTCLDAIQMAFMRHQGDSSASLLSPQQLLLACAHELKTTVSHGQQAEVELLCCRIQHPVLFALSLGFESKASFQVIEAAQLRLDIVSAPNYVPDTLVRESLEMIAFIQSHCDAASLVLLNDFMLSLRSHEALLIQQIPDCVVLFSTIFYALAADGHVSLMGLLLYLYVRLITTAEENAQRERTMAEERKLFSSLQKKRYPDRAVSQPAVHFERHVLLTHPISYEHHALLLPDYPIPPLSPSIVLYQQKCQTLIDYLTLFHGSTVAFASHRLADKLAFIFSHPIDHCDQAQLVRDALTVWLQQTSRSPGIDRRLTRHVIQRGAGLIVLLQQMDEGTFVDENP